MSNSNDWPEEAKYEISRLEFENDALQQEVGRSVAKIISLQGEGDQITDGDLKKRFEDICANIEDWSTAIEVEFLQQGREFFHVFHQMLEDEYGQSLLYRWGLLEKTYDGVEEIGKLYWLGQLDTCIKVVLSRVIWQLLYDGIFAKTYPLGTEDEAASGLHYITEAIRHGADGKLSEESVLRANKWRSSAFSSLGTTARFRSARNTHLEKILDSLRDTLRGPPLSMDETTFRKHALNLRDGIIVAAANLKQEMVCSTFEYSILDPRSGLSPQAQLHESTLKDIGSWRVVNQSQSVGGIFLCLFPGVYKKAAKDGELSPLVRPVLITFHQDAARSLQAFQSQGAGPRPNQRRKSEPSFNPHRPDGKSGEEAVRSPRRGKQSERAGGSIFQWGYNSIKNIRGRQPEEGSRSNARSNMDSPGGSAVEDKTKQQKSRGPTQSGQKRPHKRSSRAAVSTTSSTAASADSQGRKLASMRREDSGRDLIGDLDATPKNSAQELPATAIRDVRSPQRSVSEEQFGEDPSNSDDASPTDTTAARCEPVGSPHGRRIDVAIEGGPEQSYVLQTSLSGRGSTSVICSNWKDPYSA